MPYLYVRIKYTAPLFYYHTFYLLNSGYVYTLKYTRLSLYADHFLSLVYHMATYLFHTDQHTKLLSPLFLINHKPPHHDMATFLAFYSQIDGWEGTFFLSSDSLTSPFTTSPSSQSQMPACTHPQTNVQMDIGI